MRGVVELTLDNLREKYSWASIQEINGKYNCYNFFGRPIYEQLESLNDVDIHLTNYIEGKPDIEKL